MTGNKGEWSELYAFFKLAADGKLYAADANTNKIESIYYDILKLIRSQKDGKWSYVRNGNIKVVFESTGEEIAVIPISEFKEKAELLLASIKAAKDKNGSFEVPEIENFANRIKCNTPKAKSIDKEDITLVIHDVKTGSTPTLGFSIKSQLGSPSTLLNASGATNFLYELKGRKMTVEEIETFDGLKGYKRKFEFLDTLGVSLKFYKIENKIFQSNLMLIDTFMPDIVAYMIEMHFRKKAVKVEDLTKLCAVKNICNVETNDNYVYYSFKIKELLTGVALGMMPNTPWKGNYAATGGYIIVRDDGDVLCYHIYNRNEFREYLFNNTKFDTPGSTKHNYGYIEEKDGKQVLKLNFQIRFIK